MGNGNDPLPGQYHEYAPRDLGIECPNYRSAESHIVPSRHKVGPKGLAAYGRPGRRVVDLCKLRNGCFQS